MLKNLVLGIGIFLLTLFVAIFYYDSTRILTYLAVIPVVGAPLLLRKTKYKLNSNNLFSYYLFVFFAYFCGCVINLYNSVWWYDIFIHFCSGVFSFLVGMFLLKREQIEAGKWFSALLGICVVMFVAGLWELFEFSIDFVLNMNLQHSVETGVSDTMIDILAALIGGILASLAQVIKK